MWEKNKRTTECDKRTVTCDIRITQCEDGTVKCKKNVRESPNVTKELSHVTKELSRDKNRPNVMLVLLNMTIEPSNLRGKKKGTTICDKRTVKYDIGIA